MEIFWHKELQLVARVNIIFNVVNGSPEAAQIGAATHQKNQQVHISKRSSSSEDSLTLIPVRYSGIGFFFYGLCCEKGFNFKKSFQS